MQATFSINVDNLTSDFVDGIRKVFSSNAVIHITLFKTAGEDDLTKTTGKRAYTRKSTAINPVKELALTSGKQNQGKERKKPGPKPKTTLI